MYRVSEVLLTEELVMKSEAEIKMGSESKKDDRDSDSDSEDDFKIILNETPVAGDPAQVACGQRNAWKIKGCAWSRTGLGYNNYVYPFDRSRFKYVRPGAIARPGGTSGQVCRRGGETTGCVKPDGSLGFLSGQRRAILPTGRRIPVECGSGERLPSIDTSPPQQRDSDAVEIVLQTCSTVDGLRPERSTCDTSKTCSTEYQKRRDDGKKGVQDGWSRRAEDVKRRRVEDDYNHKRKDDHVQLSVGVRHGRDNDRHGRRLKDEDIGKKRHIEEFGHRHGRPLCYAH